MDSHRQFILTKIVQNCICYGPECSVGTRTLLLDYPPCNINISFQMDLVVVGIDSVCGFALIVSSLCCQNCLQHILLPAFIFVPTLCELFTSACIGNEWRSRMSLAHGGWSLFLFDLLKVTDQVKSTQFMVPLISKLTSNWASIFIFKNVDEIIFKWNLYYITFKRSL